MAEQHEVFPGKAPQPAPVAGRTVKLLAAAAIGTVLLFLSSLTLTGTVVFLAIATPLLVLFSPVLVPAWIVITLAAAGFLFSGSFGLAALLAAVAVYNYMTGNCPPVAHQLGVARMKRPSGAAAQLDPARMRVARVARDVEEWGKELGPKAREITGQAAAALS